jgi:hypothetical protein
MLEVGDARGCLPATLWRSSELRGRDDSSLWICSFNHMFLPYLSTVLHLTLHDSSMEGTGGMNTLYFSYLGEDAPITAPCSLRCKWRLPRNPSGGETAQPPPELLLYLTVPTHVL